MISVEFGTVLDVKWHPLEQSIGYTFGDREVLKRALTHTSYGHELLSEVASALRDNERLEFLGDAVLGVIVSDLLLELFPRSKEGSLSKMRASLVNEKALATIARSLELRKFILLGKGETKTHGYEKDSILAGTLEALIGAIYLDGGFASIYPVIRYLFEPYLYSKKQIPCYDYKTRLQELTQTKWKVIPFYELFQIHGPEHARIFEVSVWIQEKCVAQASGSSKKKAEQKCAYLAMEKLFPESIPKALCEKKTNENL